MEVNGVRKKRDQREICEDIDFVEARRSSGRVFDIFGQAMVYWFAAFVQETEAEDCKTHLDGLKRDERDRQKKIEKAERDLANWRHELENPPDVEDQTVIEAEHVSDCARCHAIV